MIFTPSQTYVLMCTLLAEQHHQDQVLRRAGERGRRVIERFPTVPFWQMEEIPQEGRQYSGWNRPRRQGG